MASFRRERFTIAHLLRLRERGELVLQPKFQRRKFWKKDARSFLIDTILRNMPMPKVYFRRTIREDTKRLVYEVVDGQQRLDACFDFYIDSLRLMKKHKLGFGNSTYNQLPEPLKRVFLGYEISTEVMEDASDPEVWAMFERLNSYTFTLNRQERINAQFFGYFKQMAYQLAAEERALDIWHALRVFSDYQIARMKEVELASDILASILEGIKGRKHIRQIYKDYDKKLPYENRIKNQFRKSMSYLYEDLGGAIRKTRFNSRTAFYSLMVAALDAKFGIPKGFGPKKFQPEAVVISRLIMTRKELKKKELTPRIADFHKSIYQGTGYAPERRIRHRYFFNLFTLPETQWNQSWL